MKRVFCLFIFLIIIYSAIAYAEEFTIHSGVHFGMTIDQVISTEESAGFRVETRQMLDGSASCINCSGKHDNLNEVKVIGQIAGVPSAYIIYHFTLSDGTLDSANYALQSANYETIKNSLISKYGEPSSDMSELCHSYLKMCVYWHYDWQVYRNGYSPDVVRNHDSWFVQQEDGSFIVIVSYDYLGYVNVGYQHFSQSEIEEALSTLHDDTTTYINQLENDL